MFSDKLGDDGVVAATLGWLVVRRVTVNVSESELDPWVDITGTGPKDDAGTVKLAVNPPIVVVVIVGGVVVIAVPLNV